MYDGAAFAIRAVVSFPRLTLLLFLTFQIADGAMTYGATSIFGTIAEGNPILVTWMLARMIGPEA